MRGMLVLAWEAKGRSCAWEERDNCPTLTIIFLGFGISQATPPASRSF